MKLTFHALPPWAQSIAVAAAGAVVPMLPALLDTPPSITPREIARAGLSAACAVAALFLRKPGAVAP